MLDIRWIRENPEALAEALVKRQWSAEKAKETVDDLISRDELRRAHLGRLQERQERRNAASKEIGNAMRDKNMELAETLKAEVNEIKAFLSGAEAEERRVQEPGLLEDRQPDQAGGEIRDAERDGEDVEDGAAAGVEPRDDRGHGERQRELDRHDHRGEDEGVSKRGGDFQCPAMRW